jgi:soluble lytic murein transglycosylase-like protein
MWRSILAVCLVAALIAWPVTREWSSDSDIAVAPLPSDTVAVRPPADAADVTQVIEPKAEPSPKPLAAPTQPLEPWGSKVEPISTAASFVYSRNHPATPLPALAFAAMASSGEEANADEFGPTYAVPEKPFDASPGQVRLLSRSGLCSAIVAVAKANDLPIPFFANLIWQESSFKSRTISRAGALGIAQFIPETAVEHGLMNPFEPIHALFASGRLLRKLTNQFGNLGLAAAAYNAGPQRVTDWIAVRRGLPAETRDYVVRITGHRANRWLSSAFRRDPEATLMPARAPCAEVAAEVNAQAHFVRVARLMGDLVAATSPPPPPDQARVAAAPANRAKLAHDKPAKKTIVALQDQTRIAAAPADRAKLAHDKTAKKKVVAPQKPAAKPEPQIRVAGATKDQSKPPADRTKIAHDKPEKKKIAAAQKPAAEPKPQIRVAGAMKDQSKPPAARRPARSAQAAVRPIAAE